MFVTNHVLSGVLIGRWLRRRPATAFVVGFASHLLLDATPHWGCDRRSADGAERFLRVARRDGVAGLTAMAAATLGVDAADRRATVAAMTGAVLLDVDKPLGHFVGLDPFPKALTALHQRVQNESPSAMPNEIVYGLAFAAAGAIVTVAARRRSVAAPRPRARRRPHGALPASVRPGLTSGHVRPHRSAMNRGR